MSLPPAFHFFLAKAFWGFPLEVVLTDEVVARFTMMYQEIFTLRL
jgi:hypothetical protein